MATYKETYGAAAQAKDIKNGERWMAGMVIAIITGIIYLFVRNKRKAKARELAIAEAQAKILEHEVKNSYVIQSIEHAALANGNKYIVLVLSKSNGQVMKRKFFENSVNYDRWLLGELIEGSVITIE